MTQPRTDSPPMLGRPSLRERGWTYTMIDRLLPEPDLIAPNPHYKYGPPRKLWLQSRVEAIEASDEFRIARRQAAPRQAAAKKAIATKARETGRYVEGVAIEVPDIPEADLIEYACRHYNYRKSARDDDDFRPATPQSDEGFLRRIAVNYLRHHLTEYETHLARVAGKVGTDAAYVGIKAKVLDAIAAAYPWLTAECERQKGG